MELERRVEQNYGHGALEQAILAALVASGKPLDRLTSADLAPVDEFHIGGRQATMELADRMAVAPGMRLLDIGSGLGGPSRYFAGERGCEVAGVDLTAEYVAVASALAQRVGLASRVAYHCGSALQLPFADATFDGAYMMHVGMNIADKAALFRQARRVLKPGGVFGVYDVMREQPGDLAFPAPWANEATTSFLDSAPVYVAALREAGFETSPPLSRRDLAVAFFQRMRDAAAQNGGAPPPLGQHILMGANARDKIDNMVANLQRGLFAPTEIIARAV